MTRALIPSLSLIVLAAAACAPQTPPPPDLAAEEQAVRAVSMQWLEYEKAKDIAAIIGLFTDDGVVIGENLEPVPAHAGYEAQRTSYWAANPSLVVSWATDRVQVATSADLAVEWGSWSETGRGPDGTGEDHGRYVTVYRKVNGVWKVASDIGLSTKPE